MSSGLEALQAGAAADRAPALVAHLFQLGSPLPPPPPQHGGEGSSKDGSGGEGSETLALELSSFIAKQTREYIWHTGHPPSVVSSSSSGGASDSGSPQSAPLLTLRLDTPIAAPDTDEWYALHLLVLFAATSPTLAHTRLAVQTFDSDGDFLLIQGADELPEWIEPSNAQNRVWLLPRRDSLKGKGGEGRYPLAELHLIGPDLSALPNDDASAKDQDDDQVQVNDALRILAEQVDRTATAESPASLASASLQRVALEPMLDFVTPSLQEPHSNIHRTLAYLPNEQVASLLQNEPQLCAQAIGALEGLSADQVDRRVIARMERFGPLLQASGASTPARQASSQPSSAVLAAVPLTKALYALTLYLVFFPPKPHFPQGWRDAVATYRATQAEESSNPTAEGSSSNQGTAMIIDLDGEAERKSRRQKRDMEEGRWRDIGAKLICGLELLYARGRLRQRKVSRADAAATKNMAGRAAAQGSAQLEEEKQHNGAEGPASRYRLESIPGLVDSYLDPQGPVDSAASAPGQKATASIVDPHSELNQLLALESSTEWLEELTQQRHSHAEDDDDLQDGDDAEDDALTRLQNLVQGTTAFIEDGEGDYRGALFQDDWDGEATDDGSVSDHGGKDVEQDALQDAQRRRDELASAIDAVPHGNWSRTSAPSASTSLARHHDPGTPYDCHQDRRAQAQVRADAKLLRRDKHDGVSDEEGGESDEEKGENSAAAEADDAAQRAQWAQRLRLDELPTVPSADRFNEQGQPSKQHGFGGSEGTDIEIADGPGIGPDGKDQQDDEMANFLNFTRRELGIDDALWSKIQADRRRDGRYLPPSSGKEPDRGSAATAALASTGKQETAKSVRFSGLSKGFLNKDKGRQGPPSTSATTSSSAAQVRDAPRRSASAKGKDKATIQDDDGFYALMDRMDAELAAVQGGGRSSGSRSATAAAAAAASRTSKSRPTPADEMQLDSDEDGEEDSDGDGDGGSDGDSLGELDAQEAELLQKLVRSQGEALRQAGGGGGGSEEAEMLANFLTSLRAQGAAPGPVSNLAGRLGVGHLPRDDI